MKLGLSLVQCLTLGWASDAKISVHKERQGLYPQKYLGKLGEGKTNIY